jgi:hypothetical protein
VIYDVVNALKANPYLVTPKVPAAKK